ncbi:MAG: hypothetical protein LBJ63_04600 [Prevotellaceae bacterium]|jgi:hypothetical protein|nr:hypothetical protein [Prevotellaceae bacterium]
MISKYRADFTGVHLLHYDYVNSDKKDSKSDNDVFWILAFKKPIVETQSIFTGITGTVANVYVSAGEEIIDTSKVMFRLYDGFNYINITNIGLGNIKIMTVNVSAGQNVNPDNVATYAPIGQYRYEAISGKDELGFTINGLEGGGYFNILLSPKHMLKNHAAFFASILDKHAKILRYTSSTETISDLSITFADATKNVIEKADLSIANAEPFFKPVLFKFDCIVRKSLPQILGDSPSGYFTFRYNNLELKGFPIDVQGSYVDSEQTVKCIAHPDTPNNIQEILHKRLPNKLYK